jgi:hypothetical protein
MEESFGFHKNREFLEHLNHYQLLKEELSYYAIRRGLQILFLEYFSPASPFSQT